MHRIMQGTPKTPSEAATIVYDMLPSEKKLSILEKKLAELESFESERDRDKDRDRERIRQQNSDHEGRGHEPYRDDDAMHDREQIGRMQAEWDRNSERVNETTRGNRSYIPPEFAHSSTPSNAAIIFSGSIESNAPVRDAQPQVRPRESVSKGRKHSNDTVHEENSEQSEIDCGSGEKSRCNDHLRYCLKCATGTARSRYKLCV